MPPFGCPMETLTISQQVRFRQIQKKYDFDLAPKGTPKAAGAQSGGSQKRKANAQANEGDKSGATEETPSKKPKQPARKRNAATGGKGKAKAKDNANEQKTGDDTSTTGDDGAVDNEAIVKMEAGGVEDGEEEDVELAGGNTIMKSSPAGPVGDDYLPLTVAPSVLTADPMQNRAPPFFGGGILPPAFQPYHMGTGPYGQLDVDPAGIFAGFHGLPFGGQNNQHAASPYAGRLKREDDEEHAI